MLERVFVSYSRRNKTFAERLARDLSDAGLDVWIDFRQIHAGEKWRDEIFRGLERSEIVVAVLSPDAIASEWVQTEINTAREWEKLILPVMAVEAMKDIQQSTVLGWLLELQFINFQTRYEEAFPELLAALPGRRRVGTFNPVDVANIANPFKGLEAFQQTDAAFFFGRDALIEKALLRLREDRETRFLAVVGASGSGKSSLVRAGVIPALRQGALPGSEQWRIVIFTPGDKPVDALSARLAPLIASRETNEVYSLLNETADYFEPLVAQALADAAPDARLLLVVDQFEEIFTRAGETQRRMFIEILRQAVTQVNGRAHVLITMRSDFFDRLSHYPTLAELYEQENMVIVAEMTSAELLQAIEGPAEAVGLTYDPGLSQRILEEVQREPGSLPLLQYALKELFARRNGTRLTREAYLEIGGVQQALAQHAETIYSELGAAQQAIMRRVLLRLIEVSETGEATRRKVNRADLSFRDVPDEAVQELLDLLTSAQSRLLIASREIKSASDEGDPVIWVEIGHEALIRQWERFEGWVRENLENLRYGSEVMKSAFNWQHGGGDESYLLTGNRLMRAEIWLQSADATDLQRAYIQASIEESERREQQRQKQVERELELQRRAARRLRLVAVVLVIGLLAAVILTAIALRQQDLANQAQAKAEANERQALINEGRARSLALASGADRALGDGDTELAVLLAIEANRIENAPAQSSRTLSEVAYAPGTRTLFTGHDSDVQDAVFLPDGQVLSADGNQLILWQPTSSGGEPPTEIRRMGEGGHANNILAFALRPGTEGQQVITVGDDGLLILWDVTTGEVLRRYAEQHSGIISAVAFSPDGSQVLSGGTDEKVVLWDVETGQVVAEFNDLQEPVSAVAYTRTRIITGYTDGRVALWSATNYGLITVITPGSDGEIPVRINSLASHPDPDIPRVLIGLSDGRAQIWNLDNISSGALREFVSRDGSGVREAVYSPDGREVITGLVSGVVEIWDVTSGGLLLTFDAHTDDVTSVAFDATGRLALSGSQDDTIRIWDTRSGSEIRTYAGHGGSHAVVGVYGPDERTILSSSSDPDAADGDYTARLWQIESGLTTQEFREHTAQITGVAMSNDGTQALAASQDGTIIVWDVASGEAILTLNLPETISKGGSIESLALIPSSYRVAGGTSNGDIVVWDLNNGAVVTVFPAAVQKNEPGHEGAVNALVVSPEGRRLISGGQDQDLILWDLTNQSFVRRLEGHTDAVRDVAFSADGRFVISGSVDTNLLLWDLDVTSPTFGESIRQFEGHDSVVFAVDFAPNGNSVISASRDGTIRLWDVSNGFELRRFSSDDGAVPRTVDFSSDGRTVLTGMSDSTLREWRVLTRQNDLIAWSLGNRFVREPNCRERRLFDIVPLCDDKGNPPPARESFPMPTATPVFEVPQLVVGGTAVVNTDGGTSLRLRSEPGDSTTDNITTLLPDGTLVTLVDGPVRVDGLLWWLIEAADGQQGWAVESVPEDGLQTLVAQ